MPDINNNTDDIEENNIVKDSLQIDELLKDNISLVHGEHASIISDAIDSINSENINGELFENIAPIDLAHAAILQKDKEQAFNYYKKILEEDENNIEAMYFMGYYYKSYGNNEAALALFEKINSLGIINASVYENIAMLDVSKTQEYFSKALKIYNNIDINYYHLKRILYVTLERYKNEDYENAYNYCLLAIMINESIFLYNLMGCICYKLKNYDDALSSFYNAITKESKTNYTVLCNIAHCYKEKGNLELAIHYFFKAIKLSDKHDKKLFFALGNAHYSLNNYVYAMYCFKKAIELDNNYTQAIDMLKETEIIITKE